MNKYFIGIDVGIRSSSICVIDDEKQVVRRWQGLTNNIIKELEQIQARLAGEHKGVIEAGPLAESICNKVEALGISIEIIDSRHTKALLHGKKKTDRIDAQVLAELAKMGWYKAIYRKSGKAREQRTIISGRAALVNVCTTLKNTIRGLLKAHGIVLRVGGEGMEFVKHVNEAINDLSAEIKRTVGDLLDTWYDAYSRQRKGYKNLTKLAEEDVVAKRLMTVPGVGPATAIAFVATIANPSRFQDAKQIAGYLGLAPAVHQSGDTHFHGRITKKGDSLLRWLLVEAANNILTRVKSSFPLREWGLKLEKEKGSAKAKVAVARRLAILLFTLWTTEKDFQLQAA